MRVGVWGGGVGGWGGIWRIKERIRNRTPRRFHAPPTCSKWSECAKCAIGVGGWGKWVGKRLGGVEVYVEHFLEFSSGSRWDQGVQMESECSTVAAIYSQPVIPPPFVAPTTTASSRATPGAPRATLAPSHPPTSPTRRRGTVPP